MYANDQEQRDYALRLFGDDAAKALGEIATASEQERRAAIADPVPYLERAGLRPPQGVTVTMMERRPDLGGDLEGQGLPQPGGPTGEPGLEIGLEQIPLLICFHICFPRSKDLAQISRLRRCIEICF